MSREDQFTRIIMSLGALIAIASTSLVWADTGQGISMQTRPAFGLEIFYEKVPGSAWHSPDATWWGYNQSKIVRFGDRVFMYVIENTDDSNRTPSLFTLYQKNGNEAWKRGPGFPTSRPGNILIDSRGTLHAFVFEPSDIEHDDSIGRLSHYSFPDASTGDIFHYEHDLVVPAQDTVETVNIRVGAAIGQDDTMAVAFGLTKYNEWYGNESEHVYIKKPSDKFWTHHIVGRDLGHDFFYPFVAVGDDSDLHLLPVQDDWADDGDPETYDNIYQSIPYFSYQDGQWTQEMIVDHMDHAYAQKRPRLVEQSDLFIDARGDVHIVYKEFLHPKNPWQTSAIWHLVKYGKDWKKEALQIEPHEVEWVRIFEVEGVLYYLGTAWNTAYIRKADGGRWTRLPLPKGVLAIYPYVATPKGGTPRDAAFVDILLLGAESRGYKKSAHYYVRIPVAELRKI